MLLLEDHGAIPRFLRRTADGGFAYPWLLRGVYVPLRATVTEPVTRDDKVLASPHLTEHDRKVIRWLLDQEALSAREKAAITRSKTAAKKQDLAERKAAAKSAARQNFLQHFKPMWG